MCSVPIACNNLQAKDGNRVTKTDNSSGLFYTLYINLFIQLLSEPCSLSSAFMPPCRLWIRGFPELAFLMLLESTRLPFDPKILSDCHSNTPICQNSITHTSASPLPEILTGLPGHQTLEKRLWARNWSHATKMGTFGLLWLHFCQCLLHVLNQWYSTNTTLFLRDTNLHVHWESYLIWNHMMTIKTV